MTKTPQRWRLKKRTKTGTKNAWQVKVETAKGSNENTSEVKTEEKNTYLCYVFPALINSLVC